MKRSFNGEKLTPYFFILPFMVSFLVFFFIPSLYSLVLSFFKYKGYGTMTFVGFDNYKALVTYDAFQQSVGNTFYYFIAHAIPTMIFAFVLAYMLQSKLLSGSQRIFKPMLFLPQIVPIIATSLIWKIMLSRDYGAINQLLGTSIDFLSAASPIRKLSVVMMQIWRATGWYMIIFLAGLTTISDEITDAAKIDGANVLQRIFRIVLPMMKPIFLFAFIMNAIGAIKLYTEPNILLSTGTMISEPNAMTIMNILRMNLLGASFGMAAAVGWMVFIIVMLIALLQFKVLGNKED
ncbi:MAG: sugar ABC transporter permease [Treponema sp.]|nr:sugar ABC transporter permease [Treponema sp.]